LIASVLTLVVLHGINSWKVLSIIYLNYRVVKSGLPALAHKYWPGIFIICNMIILLVNEQSGGLELGHILPILDIPVSVSELR
jgi:hypothetical protein